MRNPGYFLRTLFIVVAFFPLTAFSSSGPNKPYQEWCVGTNDLVPFGWLGLSPEQRRQIRAIQHDSQKRNWEIIGKIVDINAELEELYDTDTPDSKKIGAAYSRMATFEQRMIENDVETWNRIHALLTPNQKERLKNSNQDDVDPQSKANDCVRATSNTVTWRATVFSETVHL